MLLVYTLTHYLGVIAVKRRRGRRKCTAIKKRIYFWGYDSVSGVGVGVFALQKVVYLTSAFQLFVDGGGALPGSRLSLQLGCR
jgi:hypothetical protein